MSNEVVIFSWVGCILFWVLLVEGESRNPFQWLLGGVCTWGSRPNLLFNPCEHIEGCVGVGLDSCFHCVISTSNYPIKPHFWCRGGKGIWLIQGPNTNSIKCTIESSDQIVSSISEMVNYPPTSLMIWSNGLKIWNPRYLIEFQTFFNGLDTKTSIFLKLGLIACFVALQQHSQGFFFNFFQNTKKINYIFEYPLWSTLTYQKDRVGFFGRYMTVFTISKIFKA